MRYLDLDQPHLRLTPSSAKKSRRYFRWLRLAGIIGLLGGIFYAGYILFWPAQATLEDLFKAPQAVLSFIQPPEAQLKTTNGRTNILLLGVDYRTDMPSENLSDTMMVASIDTTAKNKDVVLISIPRDLWVTLPGWKYGEKNQFNFYTQGSKINAANAYGDAYDYPNGKGMELAREEVQQVLGIQIHYVVKVNFYGFKQIVDDLGGISVNVENSFTDCQYPIEGRENAYPISSRFMCVSFQKGYQYMNGEKALEFARSRHSDDNPLEASDLARAKRQQKVMVAIRDKALSIGTLIDPLKVSSLIKGLGDNIETLDVDFGQIGSFYKMAQAINVDTAQHIVLTDNPDYNPDGTVLLKVGNSSLYGGAFVFLPLAGQDNYTQIQAYVARKLAEAGLPPTTATSSAQSR